MAHLVSKELLVTRNMNYNAFKSLTREPRDSINNAKVAILFMKYQHVNKEGVEACNTHGKVSNV